MSATNLFTLLKSNLFLFSFNNKITMDGIKIAKTKDQNNRAVEIHMGKSEELNKTPTKILFWKVISGNKSNPKINPNIIAIIVFFSLMLSLNIP